MEPINPSGQAPNPNLDKLIDELTGVNVAPPVEPPPVTAPEPPPEPPDPRAKRKYLPRALNLSVGASRLEGTFYQMPNGQLNLEGTFGAQSFDSLDQALSLAALPAADQTKLLDRIGRLSNQPLRF